MKTDTILAIIGLLMPWISLFLCIFVYGSSNDIDKKTMEFLKKSL